MDEQSIRAIIREVLERQMPSEANAPSQAQSQPCAKPLGGAVGGAVPLEVSARHVHLTAQALEQLFGAGAKLVKKRDLSQPGEFLSEQRVKLVTAKGVIENVAVLGPVRKATQVELSMTDCRTLGVQAPVNLSGDLTNAGDVMLVGDCGCMNAPGSVIVARAHVHMTPDDACKFGVRDGEHVSVAIQSARPVTLGDVIVRVRENFALTCHIDFDEANAANVSCGASARIVGGADACQTATLPACAAPLAPQAEIPLFDGKLVTEAMAVAVRSHGATVRVKKGTILTPAARDVFSNAHMRLELV